MSRLRKISQMAKLAAFLTCILEKFHNWKNWRIPEEFRNHLLFWQESYLEKFWWILCVRLSYRHCNSEFRKKFMDGIQIWKSSKLLSKIEIKYVILTYPNSGLLLDLGWARSKFERKFSGLFSGSWRSCHHLTEKKYKHSIKTITLNPVNNAIIPPIQPINSSYSMISLLSNNNEEDLFMF